MAFAESRVTVDVVVLKSTATDAAKNNGAAPHQKSAFEILLIERGHPPYAGSYALPGGFLDDTDESLERAGQRELEEETSVKIELDELINFGGYGDIGRDPRGRTVTVAFAVVIDRVRASQAKAGDDASQCQFFRLDKLPELAFDHAKIINDALQRLAIT